MGGLVTFGPEIIKGRAALLVSAAATSLAFALSGCSLAAHNDSSGKASAYTVPPAAAAKDLLPTVTVPTYTQLVSLGSDLNMPGGHAWSTGGHVANGEVATIGEIFLCTAGPPASVQVVAVNALRARNPLRVIAFSTRAPGPEGLGFNLGPLDGSGFPASGAQVTSCHGSYQEALVGVPKVASAELGVEFKMTSARQEEDDGLEITYRGPDGLLRSVDVPLDVQFCASADSC